MFKEKPYHLKNNESLWGESSGIRRQLQKRNQQIIADLSLQEHAETAVPNLFICDDNPEHSLSERLLREIGTNVSTNENVKF